MEVWYSFAEVLQRFVLAGLPYRSRSDSQFAPYRLEQTAPRNHLQRPAAAEYANQPPDVEEGEVGYRLGFALDIPFLGGSAENVRVASGACPRWGTILAQLKERLRPDLFERWFVPLHGEFCDNDLVVTAPDCFHAAFIEDNYGAFLMEMARKLVGLNGRLCVRVSA